MIPRSFPRIRLETQLAFVAVLHGAAQGRILAALSKTEPCSAQELRKIERMLDQVAARGFGGT